jgi:hypothetical protein
MEFSSREGLLFEMHSDQDDVGGSSAPWRFFRFLGNQFGLLFACRLMRLAKHHDTYDRPSSYVMFLGLGHLSPATRSLTSQSYLAKSDLNLSDSSTPHMLAASWRGASGHRDVRAAGLGFTEEPIVVVARSTPGWALGQATTSAMPSTSLHSFKTTWIGLRRRGRPLIRTRGWSFIMDKCGRWRVAFLLNVDCSVTTSASSSTVCGECSIY